MAILFVSFPDTVTAYDDEIIIAAEFDTLNIWMSGNGLPMIFQIVILFVMVVAEASGKVEMIVDATALYFRARRHDSLQL